MVVVESAGLAGAAMCMALAVWVSANWTIAGLILLGVLVADMLGERIRGQASTRSDPMVGDQVEEEVDEVLRCSHVRVAGEYSEALASGSDRTLHWVSAH